MKMSKDFYSNYGILDTIKSPEKRYEPVCGTRPNVMDYPDDEMDTYDSHLAQYEKCVAAEEIKYQQDTADSGTKLTTTLGGLTDSIKSIFSGNTTRTSTAPTYQGDGYQVALGDTTQPAKKILGMPAALFFTILVLVVILVVFIIKKSQSN